MPTSKPTARAAFGQWLCRLLVRVFGLLYLIVLLLAGISALGWFGAPSPLPGVFLVVLGLPWTLAAAFVDDQWQPLAAALAPAINLLILAVLCRRRRAAGER